MSNEIYNPEDVKNEYINNVIPEYGRTYSRQQLDLAIYMLTDFVNNLTANNLVLLRYEPEPVRQPTQQQYQAPQQQAPRGPPPRQPIPQYMPEYSQNQNPFQDVEEVDTQEYADPRTQRMRVDDFRVQREVAEMNAQLRTPQMPRQQQPMPQQQQQQPIQQDINLASEKNKTFVDKIREMRNPKKKDNINPEE